MMPNRPVSVALVDCGEPPFVANQLLAYLRKLYDVKLVAPEEADYIIHSCMGYRVLRYSGIRIFVTGELVSADYNICDYSLCFDRLEHGDRHLWLPLIKLYSEAYGSLVRQRRDPDIIISEKKHFCSYVMSNTKNSAPERTLIYELLNSYKKVNCGGRWNNNVGGRVPDKHEFQKTHKFVIAFENHSSPGYLTEKFAEAAMVDAIPIYWGDPGIGEFFNTDAFVNCHDFNSLEEVIERVKEIDQDERIYRKMLSQHWFKDGVEPMALSDGVISAFLRNIFDQPKLKAYRRNQSRWGKKYEHRLKRMWDHPFTHALQRLRNFLRGK